MYHQPCVILTTTSYYSASIKLDPCVTLLLYVSLALCDSHNKLLLIPLPLLTSIYVYHYNSEYRQFSVPCTSIKKETSALS